MIGQDITPSSHNVCPHLGKKFQPFVNPQLEAPYSFYKRAREEEPIFYSPLLNSYVVTRYDDILAILKEPTKFSSADNLPPIREYAPEAIDVLRQGFPQGSDLVNSDGEYHKRLRSPFLQVFAPEKLQAMEDSIRNIANRLVDSFIEDGQVEIIAEFAHPLPLEVILMMYGVPLKMIEKFKHWEHDTTALIFSPLTPEKQVKCARSFVEMQYALAASIEERQKNPQNDLISEIQDSGLSVNEMIIALCELLGAGHKTTSHLIGNSLKLLLEQPKLWQALCDNPSLIPTAIEEVLRYDSPVAAIIRTTTQDVELAGVELPKGSRLFLMYGSANHDETKYPHGDRFEIGRFQQAASKHLSFGYGVHRCIGSNLARREGRIALEVLSKRLAHLRLRPNQQLTYIPTLKLRGLTHLYVEWDVASEVNGTLVNLGQKTGKTD